MAWFARSFEFDGIPCERFGNLRIYDYNVSATKESIAGSETEPVEKWIYRRIKPYYFGRAYKSVLELDIVFGSESYVTAFERNMIQRWLLGREGHLVLKIIQDDLSDCYFNVLFTSANNFYVGNLQYAFSLHGVCDAPWAWGYTKTINKNYAGNSVITDNITFNNLSAYVDTLKPVFAFTTNSAGNYFSLTNTTTGSSTSFTGISGSETITVDNDRKIITSSLGLYRLSTFNKTWLELIPGINSLHIVGGISNFNMQYQLAKKVGA